MKPTSTPLSVNSPAMLQDAQLWAAILEAIRTEKQAMYFYQRAALRMQDPAARKIFERLAAEEREHLDCFFEIYRGAEIPDLSAFLDNTEDARNWLNELDSLCSANFSDCDALRLAMLKELNLERELRETAVLIADPAARTVYEVNADSTRQHYLAIRDELRRLCEG